MLETFCEFQGYDEDYTLAEKLNPVLFDPAEIKISNGFQPEVKALLNSAIAPYLKNQKEQDQLSRFLLNVCSYSPFLADLMQKDPEFAAKCCTTPPRDLFNQIVCSLDTAWKKVENAHAFAQFLRYSRKKVALLVALCDLGGLWPVEVATTALTDFADAVLSASINFQLVSAARRGQFLPVDPENPQKDSGLVVLALGKHGAKELNYSSDIDLIVLYDAQKAPLSGDLEPGKFFVRLTRSLVSMLQEMTADGYVFRVDLRLRPDPAATAIAINIEAALSYYESWGQTWERAAMSKARAVAGDLSTGNAFLKEISPFIWRRFLDHSALTDLHNMRRRSQDHHGHNIISVAGHNIKQGRGGIREIEFLIQAQQLIYGGKHPKIRHRSTIGGITLLENAAWISKEDAQKLRQSYKFFRLIEHRLQMIEDEQTQELPKDKQELTLFAMFCGFCSLDAFSQVLTLHMERVAALYDNFFERLGVKADHSQSIGFLNFAMDEPSPQSLEYLENVGFSDPQGVSRILKRWLEQKYAVNRSSAAKEHFTAIFPEILRLLGKSDNPTQGIIHFDNFLQQLPAGAQLFAALRSAPRLLELLINIMGSAPKLASVVARRPRVLDALLDPAFFGPLPNRTLLEPLFERVLDESLDFEQSLDAVRILVQEQQFLIGARSIVEDFPFEDISETYSTLATLTVEVMLSLVPQSMRKASDVVSNTPIAVLAMGKLGSKEMTAGSDLDLILLYDEPTSPSGSSDLGESGGSFFARLTKRLVTALSVSTAQGGLYEVDLRLRPSGKNGPVATSFEAFWNYQWHEAWTWEHMALTRARPLGPDRAFNKRIEQSINEVLIHPRDRHKIIQDSAEMRARITDVKGSDNPWNVKLVRGGLVDIEFYVQILQLIHGPENPGILKRSVLNVLERAAESCIISEVVSHKLKTGYVLQSTIAQFTKLCLGEEYYPASQNKAFSSLLTAKLGLKSVEELEQLLIQTQKDISKITMLDNNNFSS